MATLPSSPCRTETRTVRREDLDDARLPSTPCGAVTTYMTTDEAVLPSTPCRTETRTMRMEDLEPARLPSTPCVATVSYKTYNNSSSGHRKRHKEGSIYPEKDSNWYRNRGYAEDDSLAKHEGKSTLMLDFVKSENKAAHRTDRYGIKDLIVRRGQDFTLNVVFKSQKYDKDNVTIQFLLSKGNFPQESKGTLVRIDVLKDKKAASEKGKTGHWTGYISSVHGKPGETTFSIVVNSPADALVGKYAVKTNIYAGDVREDRKKFSRDEEEKVYLLFNAWCKDDQVYMEDESHREEYVMNETGRIWVGQANRNGAKPWNYGQFSRYSLECAMQALDTSPAQSVGNATSACRTLSEQTPNILRGNWKPPYGGGVAPTHWNGSQAIIEQYMVDNKHTVKFGQCWVFAGVLTSLGRALGIPTRPITTFESAHDKDISMTIDNHYSLKGRPLTDFDDSVWNFHVWNESWFKRPDLPDGFDGWQAFDATPQEKSGGIYRCGPASVKAIKGGHVYLSYDTPFIFAEVNADKMTWVVSPSGDMYAVNTRTETDTVGINISTKLPGSDGRDDITHHYKHPEGSKEERKAVENAIKYSSRKKDLSDIFHQDSQDVEFTYHGVTKPNADVEIIIDMKNVSAAERNVSLSVAITAAYYTGIPAEELTSEDVNVKLDASQATKKSWLIKAESYLNIIDQDAKLKLYLMATVAETSQVYTKQDMFEIDKPELEFQIAKRKPRVGEEFEVMLQFINPVAMKLTEGVIHLEGPGIQKHLKIPIHRSIGPGETLTERITLRPKYPGKRELIACFNSRQICGITGAAAIEVV